jgi:alcohol dehydrogenase
VPEFQADHVVFKELRIVGALGVDSPAYHAALELLARGRYPFSELPRRVVGLDGAEDLIRSLAGEADVPPPVHGVVAPA